MRYWWGQTGAPSAIGGRYKIRESGMTRSHPSTAQGERVFVCGIVRDCRGLDYGLAMTKTLSSDF